MADQSQVLSVAHRLHACGARLGAFQTLINALSRGQAAQAGDLPQTPGLGRGVVTAENLNAANDEHVVAPKQPTAPIP